ncbi:DNA topoisomerase IV subunit A [Lentisphaerota bacterium WC36G]|nr:DNA topoisomerase IV subunit A [Lentisphaerae bacterium WC36]
MAEITDNNSENFDSDNIDVNNCEQAVAEKNYTNDYLRSMMDENFIEYASYVIKERAIPDIDDGLKPVQRRILWSLFRMHDGKYHKVANVIGHTMQYHPHGDASIGGALVVLANKEYYIDKQGNFGNILTGDQASAARYIECRLTPLAQEVLYNNDITDFVDSYDGRNKEPITLPVKIPALLMQGAEGIAVGMATKIMPHNFNELLQAQIAYLNKEDFTVYPDFLQGGMMDVTDYDGGNGKITLRAKIEQQGRKLIIKEIPATTTTESLIASIERAVDKSKIKVAQINDYTAENIEIEIVPARGYDPEKAMQALYTYTDCAVSVSCNMMVIQDNRPVQTNTDLVIKRNTDKLMEYLRRELEIELENLENQFHNKTLAQIFIENRIYKRIEECEEYDAVIAEVYAGLEPFKNMLKREIIDEDIERLLAIQIKRISLFDIRKNQKDIDDILAQIEKIKKHLKRLRSFTIKYLQKLLETYGHLYPRRTIIVEKFEQIDRKAAALNNIKVGWDKKNGYLGTAVKSDEMITCNEFDHLQCLERNGKYKIISIPDKIYVGKLYDCRRYDKDLEFGVVYSDTKTKKFYAKRCKIAKFIKDKEYRIIPNKSRLEVFTPRSDAMYEIKTDARVKDKKTQEISLYDYPERTPKARGILVSTNLVKKITHLRYLTLEELENYKKFGLREAPEEQFSTEDNSSNNSEVLEKVEIAHNHDVVEKIVGEAEKVTAIVEDKIEETVVENVVVEEVLEDETEAKKKQKIEIKDKSKTEITIDSESTQVEDKIDSKNNVSSDDYDEDDDIMQLELGF